jgi:hypothetical protein
LKTLLEVGEVDKNVSEIGGKSLWWKGWGGLLVQEKETKGWSFERRDEGVVPMRVPEAGEEEKKKLRGRRRLV